MGDRSKATWAIGIAILVAFSAFGVAWLSPPSARSISPLPAGTSSTPPTAPVRAATSTPGASLHPHPQVAATTSNSLSSIPSPHVVGPDLHLAHYPAAWGPAHLPPGAPIPPVTPGVSAQQFYRTWSGNGSYPIVNGACYGKWPASGQSGYSNNCYGHDEPAVNPYSDLPGSGGNVTWTVQLPIDRSPTQNQSDLYAAIWFGMNLYDPYGYNGQCFLELQLYPDTNGNFLPQPGVWSGFAVAWQIELATGFEDPCYAATLNIGNSNVPFQMTQGDTLTVRMSGWIGSPYGENVSVLDNSNGLTGFLNLYNTTAGYPLDPAFLANNIDDSLPWSPGGDSPVAFSFESGHTYGGPGNNSYGGCSSGVPPPTLLNPSTPCDSYDPQSWVNDTAQPWHFYPVQFFNAATTQTATQLGFEQDFGGITWVDPLSSGACQGRDGSAYCSYPWYSYSRTANALEFGATDFYGMTYDFGQYNQYDSTLTTNTAALGYFPVRNFTVPALIGSSLTITIVGSGTVHFLSYTLSSTTTISHLASGSYSINSVPAAGQHFLGYAQTGGVAIDAPGTPWNSFLLSATGSITATFSALSPPTVAIHFSSPGGLGSVAVSPGFNLPTTATYPGLIVAQYAPVGSTIYTNGATIHLVPGIYSIQALPGVGYNFTGWSVTGGVYAFAPQTNYTWINVTSTTGTLTAGFAATAMTDTVWLESVPASGGTITFGGVTYPSGTILNVPDGTYSIAANPNATYTFETWSYLWSASMSNFAATSEVVLQNGTSWVYALFHSTPAVTLAVAGSGSGSIALNGAVRSGVVALAQVEATSYPIVAAPQAGSTFSGWSVNDPTNLSVANSSAPVTSVTVSGTGTLTATFTASTRLAVSFDITGSGSITWNFNLNYFGTLTNYTVSPGTYAIGATAGAGAMFNGWNTTGAVSIETLYSLNGLGEWVIQYELAVTGPGTVFASFVGQTFPVTFVDDPSATGTLVTLTSTGPAVAIAGGTTGNLAAGTYSMTLSGGSILVAHWAATSNLTLAATSGLTVSITIAGSGTIYAQAIALPLVSGVTVNPTIVEPNVPFTVTASVAGGVTPLTFNFTGAATLPAGTLTCTPGILLSFWNVNTSVCTVGTAGTFAVYANVTDGPYSASGSASIQAVNGPTIGFTAPVARSQLTGTVLPLTVTWTNTIASEALPGLEETVALVDDSTGQVISNTPSDTSVGSANLLVAAGTTNSVTVSASDLLGVYASGLPPAQYTVRVAAYSTSVLGAGGFPTIGVSTNLVVFTVASLQVFAPVSGASYMAGNVSFAWQIQVPGNFTGNVTVENATSVVYNFKVSGSGEAPGAGLLSSQTLALGAGRYTANLTTFNRDAHSWYNLSVAFTVVAVPVPPPPQYHNTTAVPAYVNGLYVGLFVVGLAVGLLGMWVATRGRRRPPTVTMTPGKTTPPPPAVVAWSETPSGGTPEWSEDPPPSARR